MDADLWTANAIIVAASSVLILAILEWVGASLLTRKDLDDDGGE